METYNYVGKELELFAAATNWKRYFSRFLKPFITGNVAEIGAGEGANTLFLRHEKVASWTCLEPDGTMAKRLGERLPAWVKVRCAYLTDLATEDRFDTIIYIDVLEHIEDGAAELRCAAAHLRRGGRIIVLSPAWPKLYSAFDKAIGHYRRYTAKTLRAATPPGTVLEKMFFLDSVGLAASFANAALLKSSMPTQAQIALWDKVMVPLSRITDFCTGYRIGRSIIGIWARDDTAL